LNIINWLVEVSLSRLEIAAPFLLQMVSHYNIILAQMLRKLQAYLLTISVYTGKVLSRIISITLGFSFYY
jgi:hypothetical protein